jgi:hypothetical protein
MTRRSGRKGLCSHVVHEASNAPFNRNLELAQAGIGAGILVWNCRRNDPVNTCGCLAGLVGNALTSHFVMLKLQRYQFHEPRNGSTRD